MLFRKVAISLSQALPLPQTEPVCRGVQGGSFLWTSSCGLRPDLALAGVGLTDSESSVAQCINNQPKQHNDSSKPVTL